MKKIINTPENYVRDTIEGIIAAYGDRLKLLNGDFRMVMARQMPKPGKVGIVTGGGSGHLPLFLGYVGKGMADGCAVGNVFASPSSGKMADLIRACDFGGGVLCLYGNYGGDNMNFQMACDEVEIDGIQTEIVTAADDVASALSENAQKRRGVAGLIYAYKIAGAAADEMMNLQEVADITRKALNNIRSMGIALSPCIVPEVGVTTFTIGEDEVEIGMGIHGEKGIEVHKMMTADELAAVMLEKIVSDNPLENGDEVSVLVNGLGATPLEEQMIFYRAVHKLLDNRGVSVVLPHIGEYATSMEMAGLSLTVFKLDDQLKRLLKAPASTPFYNFS
ncbi:MAG: dihydroxyacetone kinase subunit DhaK [Schaedlerella sp.]|uniref:dihydroxyacetone kinase subunit DhaK n=1 Tax=Schaedlerella sp. TaxID=2676057 RepID=UPI00272F8B65|nr:dihydroxyacetone kinase subunit DhaK [uncultured Schaedlerella sp.]